MRLDAFSGMEPEKKKSKSRHGKLADGRSQTSVTMDEELLEWARQQARNDRRSLSNWLAMLAEKEKKKKSPAPQGE